jgi:hypothetical protein
VQEENARLRREKDDLAYKLARVEKEKTIKAF